MTPQTIVGGRVVSINPAHWAKSLLRRVEGTLFGSGVVEGED
jgi:hypothetical protein